jgi:Mn2+/Fe2+ NRAMP family transporter
MASSLTEPRPASALRRFFFIAGPGLVVMLADTDAGSLITAAQSGAQWGYRLLPVQFLLIPILYFVQELTVRLGIVTGKGHTELILERFGRFWAFVSVATLVLSCVGAILTEFSGLAGVGAMAGVPPAFTLGAVERIAIGFGAFEFVFLVAALLARPDPAAIAAQAVDLPLHDPAFLVLVSANIGAVIMPWMVFFQQTSVVERNLTVADLPLARLDTALGAVATQFVMAGALVAVAATIGASQGDRPLDTVQEIAEAVTPFLGVFGGRLLFALGMGGAAVVATIVVTLTAARAVAELLGQNNRLDHAPREAPGFYGVYFGVMVVGAAVVLSGVNVVALSVGVQVMNALLLPLALGFLFALACGLPEPFRLKGAYAWAVGALIAITVAIGVYAGVAGVFL